MAWTTPATYTDGSVLTGAQLNLVRDNLNETAPAKATTAGGIFVATGANALAQRIPTEATVLTAETTTSTAYVPLATALSVTVTTGTQAIVVMTSQGQNNTVSAVSYTAYAVSGATTTAASDDLSIYTTSSVSNDAQGVTVVDYVTGLTAGSNTFSQQYRVSSGTGTWRRRRMFVIPL